MADFSPGGNWSHTLGKDVDHCLRKAYYRVWGSWGGWSKRNGTPEAISLYFLKQCDTLPMYGGTLVHDVARLIEERIRAGLHYGGSSDESYPYPTEEGIERIVNRIESRMREDIAYSASGAWRQLESPKRATLILLEHFTGRDILPWQIDEAINRYRDCTESFLRDHLPELIELGPQNWEIVDSLDRLRYRDTDLFMAVDLLVNLEGGGKLIIDWKTGERPDADQLTIYGLYATLREAKKGTVLLPENIEGRSVTLLNPENVHVTPSFTNTDLEGALARIDNDIERIRPLAEAGLARDAAAFPKTEHKGGCQWCMYKFYCDGDRR